MPRSGPPPSGDAGVTRSPQPADAIPRVRILVVEDERKVADSLRESLTAEGYDVSVERTGESAFIRVSTEAFDTILLDLNLPGRDGMEILAALRQRNISTPVIVLTARDELSDRVAGLDAGADDYVLKPFALDELHARLRALLRRGPIGESSSIVVGSLAIDLISRIVVRDGRIIDLTTREFELLAYLMRHNGRIVSRDALARDVWNEKERSTTLDNVIDVYLTRVRHKVDDDAGTRVIHTVRGVGFTVRDGKP